MGCIELVFESFGDRNVKSVVPINDATQVTLTKNEMVLRPVLLDQLYGREYTMVCCCHALSCSVADLVRRC